MFDTDVFVLGGGPAGLAAAIAARLSRFRVLPVASLFAQQTRVELNTEISTLFLRVNDIVPIEINAVGEIKSL